MPMTVVLFGSLALVLVLAVVPPLGLGLSFQGLLGAVMILLFGFLFVTVSSRLTGEVGSSSNPISGMTIATLLLVCSIFFILGRTGPSAMLTALTVAAVVCIASCNGGTTSQDLKTGYLVGATPYKQQWAILIGAVTSALVIGLTMLGLNAAGTHYTKNGFPRDVVIKPHENEPPPTTERPGKPYNTARRSGRTRTSTASSTSVRGNMTDCKLAGISLMRPDIPFTEPTCRSLAKQRRWTTATEAPKEFTAPQPRPVREHHQGHPRRHAPVVPHPHRRDDRGRAGTVRRVGAAGRGRDVPVARLDHADLHRRNDAADRGQTPRQAEVGGRVGDEPRRAAGQRLHRRRHALRAGHRLLRHSRFWNRSRTSSTWVPMYSER